ERRSKRGWTPGEILQAQAAITPATCRFRPSCGMPHGAPRATVCGGGGEPRDLVGAITDFSRRVARVAPVVAGGRRRATTPPVTFAPEAAPKSGAKPPRLEHRQVRDGVQHPFAGVSQVRNARSGPQHLAGYRGQQLARRGPTQAAERLWPPSLGAD